MDTRSCDALCKVYIMYFIVLCQTVSRLISFISSLFVDSSVYAFDFDLFDIFDLSAISYVGIENIYDDAVAYRRSRTLLWLSGLSFPFVNFFVDLWYHDNNVKQNIWWLSWLRCCDFPLLLTVIVNKLVTTMITSLTEWSSRSVSPSLFYVFNDNVSVRMIFPSFSVTILFDLIFVVSSRVWLISCSMSRAKLISSTPLASIENGSNIRSLDCVSRSVFVVDHSFERDCRRSWSSRLSSSIMTTKSSCSS